MIETALSGVRTVVALDVASDGVVLQHAYTPALIVVRHAEVTFRHTDGGPEVAHVCVRGFRAKKDGSPSRAESGAGFYFGGTSRRKLEDAPKALQDIVAEALSQLGAGDGRRGVTPEEKAAAVNSLTQLTQDDPEAAHAKLDELLVSWEPEEVRQAVDKLVKEARWW